MQNTTHTNITCLHPHDQDINLTDSDHSTSSSNETCTIAIDAFANTTNYDSLAAAVLEIFHEIEEFYGDEAKELLEQFEIAEVRETKRYWVIGSGDERRVVEVPFEEGEGENEDKDVVFGA